MSRAIIYVHANLMYCPLKHRHPSRYCQSEYEHVYQTETDGTSTSHCTT